MSGRPAPSLALLSAITALTFCALHMVVPALPLLVAVFTDTPAHVQLVVGLYLAGIGAGQLRALSSSARQAVLESGDGDTLLAAPIAASTTAGMLAHAEMIVRIPNWF
jgi:hypothetical protein